MPGKIGSSLSELYLVRLVLPTVSGYALWGGNIDGEFDIFLAEGGRILLYGDGATIDHGESDVIDFRAAAQLLEEGHEQSSEDGGTILDCLNASTDLAKQLGDDRMRDRLTGTDAPLSILYQFLWEEADVPPWQAVKDEFRVLGRWFQERVRV
ncbi:hypothetical protein [Actinoplanes sp. NPDC026619]|uniref:hypothetical protein n=1 Tax=Actinoplanes sp. NPDC026619 TaxID=3155798 RepID=UPI0033D11BAC